MRLTRCHGSRLAGASLLLAAASATANPRVDYLLHCGGCHLENGSGSPPQVPDMRPHLADITRIPEGRAYVVRVPGSAQAPLSPSRLAAVLNWMVETFGDDVDGFRPFEAEEVARLKQEVLADPLAVRESILRKAKSAGGASAGS